MDRFVINSSSRATKYEESFKVPRHAGSYFRYISRYIFFQVGTYCLRLLRTYLPTYLPSSRSTYRKYYLFGYIIKELILKCIITFSGPDIRLA